MTKAKSYIVEVPIRGVETYVVEATSGKEAKAEVERGGGECTDLSVKFKGRPRRVWVDGGRAMHKTQERRT